MRNFLRRLILIKVNTWATITNPCRCPCVWPWRRGLWNCRQTESAAPWTWAGGWAPGSPRCRTQCQRWRQNISIVDTGSTGCSRRPGDTWDHICGSAEWGEFSGESGGEISGDSGGDNGR